MDKFVLVLFWSYILRIAINAIVISNSTYPRVERNTIGLDVFSLLLNVLFAVWAWYLLWGSR